MTKKIIFLLAVIGNHYLSDICFGSLVGLLFVSLYNMLRKKLSLEK